MRALVRQYKKDPQIILFAKSLTQSQPGKAWFAEIRACFYFVQRSIRYVQDVNEVEMLQTPVVTLQIESGDCDDMCVLLAALLESIGHPTRFAAVGFNPENKDEFEHVLLQTMIADSDEWISCDPTENHDIGWSPPGIQTWMVVSNGSA